MDNLGFYICEEVGSSNATRLAAMVSKNESQIMRVDRPTDIASPQGVLRLL
jgi:hypothetical protein